MLTGGTDDVDLKEFLKPDGNIDVLIASSRIGTGVNGLQYVCNKLIINSLPWTNAEYEQLIGRLYRQGSRFDQVRVIIPVTFAMVNGERWSYCESQAAPARVQEIDRRRRRRRGRARGQPAHARAGAAGHHGLAGAAGERQDEPRSQRPVIKIPLSGEPNEVERRVARYGDFSKMNNRWYASGSESTHARLASNPEEWAHYHTMYRQIRESWPVVPYKEEIRWLSEREGHVIGDFGCGEALIARSRPKTAIRSTASTTWRWAAAWSPATSRTCRSKTSSLDVAIFCLSLMGANFTDYVREAHRCLRLDGWLHIWEPASYFDDVTKFCSQLGRLGFDVVEPQTEGAFVRIYAARNAKKVDPTIVLPFRGHG